MRSEDLTREQSEAIKAQLTPMLRYLGRMKDRMKRRRFPPTDPLWRDVCGPYDAIHGLRMSVHYLSVGHGVGMPERKVKPRDMAQGDGVIYCT